MVGRPKKYEALRDCLIEKAKEFRESGERTPLSMTFKEIEAIGISLPKSAYNYREWWANYNRHYRKDFYEHPKAKPWERAKFRTEDVDLKTQTLKFRYCGDFSEHGIARQRAEQAAEDRAELEKLERQEKANPLSSVWNRNRMAKLKQKLTAETEETSTPGMEEGSRPYASQNNETQNGKHNNCRHPIWGALKGHIRLVAGTDLTKPADPEWGERVWGSDNK
jgi:hypothetical protein